MAATKDRDTAKDQARLQLASIVEMVAALRAAEESGDDDAREAAIQRISESPLSVEMRDGWYVPGGDHEGPEEYHILLCWGGPACRIVGTLGEHGEPETANVEYQDWGTPWTEYDSCGSAAALAAEDDALLTYAREFFPS